MRQTKIILDSQAIEHNLRIIKNHAQNSHIIPVLKANAYGHGLNEYLLLLDKLKFDRIAVAYQEEAELVKDLGFNKRILVLVPPTPDDLKSIVQMKLESSIDSFEMLDAFKDHINNSIITPEKTQLHLFVNTGMNRDGLNIEDVPEFMKKANEIPNIEIIGIMTHFADAENGIDGYAKTQYERFEKLVNDLENDGYTFDYIHAQNSSGIFNLDCPKCNTVRPGISLHGLLPNPERAKEIGLKPSLELISNIKNIYKLNSGDTSGYSFKFTASNDTKVAVIPIGYGDGLNTNLGNKAECLINGKRYPIVGSVCMDLTLIDIGNDDINIGDKVTLIGKDGDGEISVYEYADILGLIPYEITTALKGRVFRMLNVEC